MVLFSHGTLRRVVLDRFMTSVKHMSDLGASATSHNFEFDAGIIANELKNAGLEHWLDTWNKIARKATCTMDAELMLWAQDVVGVMGDEKRKAFMDLKAAVELLVPQTMETKALLPKNNNAGADAQMHRLLYITYREFVQKPGDYDA